MNKEFRKLLFIGSGYVLFIILAHLFFSFTGRYTPVYVIGEILFFLILTSILFLIIYRKMKSAGVYLDSLLRELEHPNENQQEASCAGNDTTPDPVTSLTVAKIKRHIQQLQGKNEELEKVVKDLGEKKKTFTQVIENLPIGFVVSKLVDKKILVTNKELTEIYGFCPEYLDEVNSCHLFPQEEEIAKEKGYPEEVYPADILMPKEKKGQIILNRQGQYQTVDLKRIPIKKEGLLITLVTNVSDLTEKEEELAANERLSRFIFDTAEVGLCLVDEKGYFVRVNRTFNALYGYREEELLGKHFSLLLPPEKREHFKEAYIKRMKKMVSQSTPLKEVQVLKKSGELLDVVTTSRTVYDHHFKGTIYSVLDVTDIRTDQGKLQAALDGGRLGTWNINLETGVNEVNHYWAEMLGYKKSEVIPSIDFFHTLLHPDDHAEFLKEVKRIKSGEQNTFNREIRLRCKDGTYKWILDSGKVIKKNSQGEPLLMAGCHIDIDEMKKAQLEILSQSDRLRRAQELGMVGDWELEVRTGSFNCSAMIFRIFGKRKEKHFSYEDFIRLFEPSVSQQISKKVEEAINQKKVVSHETKAYWENGSVKYVKFLAVPVLGSSGEVIKVSGILQDITGIKITRENLEETTRRLQVLSDNIPGGLLQFKVSHFFQPKLLYLSRGAEKEWGISREKVVEGDLTALFHNIHPDDHSVIHRTITLATARLQRVSLTWRTVLNSGSIKWHHGIGIPTKNEDGSVTWNALIMDVTERKESEEKIKEQEEYMQVMARHASDAIIACDQNGKVRFVNETLGKWVDPSGFSKPSHEWPRIHHLYSIEDDRLLRSSELSLFSALEKGEVINKEFLIKQPGKQERYVQSNGSALYDSKGKRIGAMVVWRDISERIQKELEVSNAIIKAREKERSQIAAEIHDGITQSLSVVAMNMKNLRLDYQDLENSQSYFKALNYLQDVIEQSRALAHEIMPNSIMDFGLIEAVNELVEQFSTGSKVNIKFEYTSYGRLVASKELHIFRVIQEGLGNALKHADATDIVLKLHFGSDHIRMILKDNGRGFDVGKSYLKQGIGLLSMRDRIKKINGRFRIFSGTKGTAVWFKVPVKKYVEENENTYSNFYS